MPAVAPWKVHLQTDDRRRELKSLVFLKQKEEIVSRSRTSALTLEAVAQVDAAPAPRLENVIATWLANCVAPREDTIDTNVEAQRRRGQIIERFARWFDAAAIRTQWCAELVDGVSRYSLQDNDQLTTAVAELFHRLSPDTPPGEDHDTSFISKGKFIWFFTRATQLLYPGLTDDMCADYLQTDAEVLLHREKGSLPPAPGTPPTLVCPFHVFATYLLYLIEPWCFTSGDALECVNQLILPNCLVGTVRDDPPGLFDSSVLPSLLSRPSHRLSHTATGTGGRPILRPTGEWANNIATLRQLRSGKQGVTSNTSSTRSGSNTNLAQISTAPTGAGSMVAQARRLPPLNTVPVGKR